MQDELGDYFRCVQDDRGWAFEVAVIGWEGPHTPIIEWRLLQRWATMPTDEQVAKARAAAMSDPRLFGRCTLCERHHCAGHMHSDSVCQGCAERNLGVVH